MEMEVQVTLVFPGLYISRCKIEKIAAGQRTC
jgi:hypothetical protein